MLRGQLNESCFILSEKIDRLPVFIQTRPVVLLCKQPFLVWCMPEKSKTWSSTTTVLLLLSVWSGGQGEGGFREKCVASSRRGNTYIRPRVLLASFCLQWTHVRFMSITWGNFRWGILSAVPAYLCLNRFQRSTVSLPPPWEVSVIAWLPAPPSSSFK